MSDKNDFDDLPDDDFYDDALDENFEFEDDSYDDVDLDDAFDENGDFVSGLEDEWDEDGEGDGEWDDTEEAAGLPPKKIGLNFNTIMLVAGVLIGGFVLYSQVTKVEAPSGPQKKAPEKIATALSMKGSFEGPGSVDPEIVSKADVVKQSTINDSDGFLFEKNPTESGNDVLSDAPPMPSPIAAEQDALDLDVNVRDMPDILSDDDVAVASNVEEDSVQQMPNSPPSGDNVPMDEVDQMNDLSMSILGEEKTLIDASDEIKDVKVTEFEEKQTEVPETLGQNTLSSMINESEEDQKKTSEKLSSTDDFSLEEKLDSIIVRLEKMDNKINEIDESNKNQIQMIVSDMEALKQNKIVTSKVTSKPQAKKLAKVKSKVSKPKKTTSKRANWELRAAQPGKAWVSKKGQSNMQPIVVGDNLTGLGRIQNISYVSGKWIVQGSSGKIMQ